MGIGATLSSSKEAGVKGKVLPVISLTEHHVMKVYWGVGA